MQDSTIILQPTASELFKYFKIASKDKTTSVKFTVEITPLSEFVTKKQAIEVLNCSPQHFENLIKNGKIQESHRVANRRLFKREVLLLLVENGDTAA